MKKAILVSFGFVGTVIGAGFASGKEITLYFSESGLFSPLLAAVFLGVFAYFFCEIGRLTRGDGYLLLGKGKAVFSCIIKLSSALVFCTTIAACEEVFFALFHVHGGAIVTAILTLATLFVHKSISSVASLLSVLAIVILLGVIFFRSDVTFPSGSFSPLSSFLYAGMNMLTGGFFISARTKDFTKKDSFYTAVLSFILLATLLLVVFLLTKSASGAIFPVLSAADRVGLGAVGSIILYLAMYTTCYGTLSVTAEKSLPLALATSSLALLVSCFGFESLIKTIYPAIGAAGCVVTVFYLFLSTYNKRKNNLVLE